jgi:formylglycine-generating enzyme required for sulfatase activity
MPNTEKRLLKVFLCHAKEDKSAVRQLYIFLRKNGIDAWLDEEKLLAGQDWKLEIPKAIYSSDAIIVCLSKNSITKEGYVQKEIKSALDVADEKPDGTIFIIPARLEECTVPGRLSQWQWLDLFNERGGEKLMRSLLTRADGLGIVINRSPLPDVALSAKGKPVQQSKLNTKLLGWFTAKKNNQINSRPLSKITNTQTWAGIEFVRIPAGEFIMGNKLTLEIASQDETPRHAVNIPYDYWIGRSAVTNAQFAEFIEWTHYAFEWTVDWKKNLDAPVVNISWADIQVYLTWLNKHFRRKLPKGSIYRLPTEAEWEKAARGTDGRQWPWGNEFDEEKCNSGESFGNFVEPIDLYSPSGDSPYGVSGMSGNAWEWTKTIYMLYPYNPNDGRENTGGLSDFDVERRYKIVLRGGSFKESYLRVRTSARGYTPNIPVEYRGIRIVVGLPRK